MTLKERLKRTYNDVSEIIEHHNREIANIGKPELPVGKICVCMLKETPISTVIQVPDNVDPDLTYEYCTVDLNNDGNLFLAQIPVYGGVLLGGSKYVRGINIADLFCYWSMRSVERMLK